METVSTVTFPLTERFMGTSAWITAAKVRPQLIGSLKLISVLEAFSGFWGFSSQLQEKLKGYQLETKLTPWTWGHHEKGCLGCRPAPKEKGAKSGFTLVPYGALKVLEGTGLEACQIFIRFKLRQWIFLYFHQVRFHFSNSCHGKNPYRNTFNRNSIDQSFFVSFIFTQFFT